MPILGNSKYQGVIHRAKLERLEKQDGGVTMFIKVRIQVVGEGFIDHSLYFTPAAVAQTKKVLGELNSEIWDGTYPYLLRDPEKFLLGRPCKIETEIHSYEDKNGIVEKSIRVKWLNGIQQGEPASESDVTRILGMMGIEDAAAQPVAVAVAEDPDQPF